MLFLYSITEEFPSEYIDNLLYKFRRENRTEIPILLVGTKIDLEEKRKIITEHVAEFATSRGCVGHVEVSAKSKINADKVFKEITRIMWRNSSTDSS